MDGLRPSKIHPSIPDSSDTLNEVEAKAQDHYSADILDYEDSSQDAKGTETTEHRPQEGSTSPTESQKDVEKTVGLHSKPSYANPFAAQKEGKDPNLVEWDGPDDPENPQNFSKPRKWLITLVFSTMTCWVTFSSSVFSPAVVATSEQFHVSTEVMTLGTSLAVLVCSS